MSERLLLAATAAVSVMLLVLPHLAVGEEFKASAPDIYPTDSRIYVGEVTVQINVNQPDASVYYTRDGSRPTNQSRVYTKPFTLFDPGNTTIRAMAIPLSKDGHIVESAVVQREYMIVPSDVLVPHVAPPRGSYRGFVKVTLFTPQDQEGAKIQYVVDVEDPGNTWLDYSQPFPLDTPGEHIVMSRGVVGTGPNAKFSPIGRFRYIVSPPLVYDVSTECVKCKKQVSVGHRFTIFLQSAEAGSKLFLTTSQKGCETQRHKLDDTEDFTVVMPRRPYYSFITYTEPVPKVFVCLMEPSNVNQTYLVVPRRAPAAGQSGLADASFEIFPAFGLVTPHPSSAPRKYVGFSPNEQNHATASIVSFIVLSAALLGISVAVTKIFLHTRGAAQHHGRRRVPTADPDDA
jgi:hypothetical protein